MKLLAHGGLEVIAYSIWIAAIASVVLVAVGVIYLALKDMMRLGRRGLSWGWAFAVIGFFGALGVVSAGYLGLVVVPVLGVAFWFSRHQAGKAAEARRTRREDPSV